MSAAASTSASAAPAEPAEKAIVDMLEEDDEFEDFAEPNWTASAEDGADTQLWQDDWDDEDIDNEFCQQLRAELQRTAALAAAATSK